MKLRRRLRAQCQEEGAQPAMELLDGQGGVSSVSMICNILIAPSDRSPFVLAEKTGSEVISNFAHVSTFFDS